MNQKTAQNILNQLYAQGVREICLCPGARNAPFVDLLSRQNQFQTYSFFDERAASFFAMGCIRRTQRPAVVLTTSGTAVAELLPAVVESHYLGLPLIALTADRPKSYRGKASPQAIEQDNIFGVYTQVSFDLENEIPEITIASEGPTHINVCFDEPLLDPQWKDAPVVSESAQRTPKTKKHAMPFFRGQKPLVILGPLSKEESRFVSENIKNWQCPVYAESLSQLRSHPSLEGREIQFGHQFLPQDMKQNRFDSVIRIGQTPCLRLWRDLEKSDMPVLNISDVPFSGLGNHNEKPLPLSALKELSFSWDRSEWQDWIRADQLRGERLRPLLKTAPQSEQALVGWLSQNLLKNCTSIFLGNSLPIREWDFWSHDKTCDAALYGQRGTNGIDGLISHFLGLSVAPGRHALVLGDLSALYDLNALWALRYLPKDSRVLIAVINNGGGQIFKPMFNQPLFENNHDLNFEAWARMFQLPYKRITEPLDETFDHGILEIVPDVSQTQAFRKTMKDVAQ